MTDKEAIKYLELHSAFNGKLDKGNCIRITEENFTKTKLAIETVLNLIQTQQEEIERLKQTELNAKGGAVKITLEGLLELKAEIEKKDQLYHRALSDLVKSDKENIKKDKIIDKMIDALMSHDEHFNYCDKKLHKKHKGNCQECLKEYFINKVEKEN